MLNPKLIQCVFQPKSHFAALGKGAGHPVSTCVWEYPIQCYTKFSVKKNKAYFLWLSNDGFKCCLLFMHGALFEILSYYILIYLLVLCCWCIICLALLFSS